ncbi:hypothetical protein [Mangrovihabitans endophyticus]|uniref:hypothetical protein n=1 Tax=Mangrovihabitans endophyticus TaxID=1751298 RepID=UPI001E49F3E6|nr:hypothetical protein [Mangrovihabitans endophyticus]
MIALAKAKGFSGYPGDGGNRWPAGHTRDVARVFRLAVERAPAGSRLHAAGEPGIPVRDIARSIGDHLGIPTRSVAPDDVVDHFGFLAALIGLDNPVSTARTRKLLGWEPTHPGLLADFATGDYFDDGAADSMRI